MTENSLIFKPENTEEDSVLIADGTNAQYIILTNTNHKYNPDGKTIYYAICTPKGDGNTDEPEFMIGNDKVDYFTTLEGAKQSCIAFNAAFVQTQNILMAEGV